MSALRGFLDVRPGEGRNTFAAFAALLGITTGHTLLETARDALFLAKVPASHLPWMYLVIAVLALGLAQIRTAARKPLIVVVLGVASSITAGFWFLGHDVGGQARVLYALYVWSGLFASWVMVQFWSLLGLAHTMTQAKRLYGFIGAGAVLGGVLGAVAARAALAFVSPRAMLLGSAGLFLISALPVLALDIPETSVDATTAQVAESIVPDSLMLASRSLWQNAFARRILGIVAIATVTVTLVDFLFKARIAEAFPGNTRALAAWLSTFYAVTNGMGLAAQLAIGPWIFRVVGVQRALFLFPLLLLLSAGGVLVSFGVLSAAVLLKGIDGAMRYSVHKTSMELLLVPIPDGTRERIKPIIDLVGSRGGQALGSLVILGLLALGVASTMMVSGLIVVLSVGWLAVVVSIRAHYLDVFRETLKLGGLSGKAELPELDLGALEMLFAGLNSSHDTEVLASLEILAEQHRAALIPALILYHPSREVVLRALELFTQRGRTDFLSIADRLNQHPDREVAAAALRAHAAVAPDRRLLESRVAEPCSLVSATALVALMARGWIDGEEANKRVREIIATRAWRPAAELARGIRDIAGRSSIETRELEERFDELLIRLAREANSFREEPCAPADAKNLGAMWGTFEMAPDLRVRMEVAKAMAVRSKPAYLPVLVGMLSRHELRSVARVAIANIPGALDFLDNVMRQRDFARSIRVHVPRTMVLLDPNNAARKLMVHLLIETDGAVRFKVLRALVRLRRANPSLVLEEDVLHRVVQKHLEHTHELRAWGRGLRAPNDLPSESLAGGRDPMRAAHHLLVDLVHDKESHSIQRLFMLLELLYGADFEDIERGLRSKLPKTRASSLELLDNLLVPPLRSQVLGLVGDDAPPDDDDEALSYEDALLAILEKGSTTMRTLAEYRALELGIDAGTVAGRRPSQAPNMELLGRRLVDRARDLLTPDSPIRPRGATRAPA